MWWAHLPEPVGSGPGFRRPVLAVQSNDFNESAIRTVIVAVLTLNLARALDRGNVFLGPDESGPARGSVVNVSQLLSIDTLLLTDRVRLLTGGRLAEVDAGLRLALSL